MIGGKKIDKSTITLFTGDIVLEDLSLIKSELEKRTKKWARASRIEKIPSESDTSSRLKPSDSITLSKDDIKENLAFNLSFKNISSMEDLLNRVNFSKNYFKDPYFHDIFVEQFPNFELLTSIITDPNIQSRLDSNSIRSLSNYSDISKEIITSAYNIKKQDIKDIQDELSSLNTEKSEIERKSLMDKTFEKIYPLKEKVDSQTGNYKQELEDIESKLQELSESTKQNELITNPESKTIFSKLRNLFNKTFNKQKIKDSEDRINSNNIKRKELEEQQKAIMRKYEEAKRKSLLIEMEFKKRTNSDISLEQYKEEKELITGNSNSQNTLQEIQERINDLCQKLLTEQGLLTEIENSGLIKSEPTKQKDDSIVQPIIQDSYER